MFPTIPEGWETLSAPELRSLAAEIRLAIQLAVADPECTAETLNLAQEAKTARAGLLAKAEEKEAEAAAEAARTSLAAEMDDDSNDVPPDVPDPDDDPDDPDADPDGGHGGESHPTDGGEDVTAQSGRTVRTSTSVGASPDASVSSSTAVLDQLVAYESAPHAKAGEPFRDWSHFAESIQDKAKLVDPSAGQKFVVGQVRGQFDEAHKLSTNMLANLALFEKSAEMTAAMCAPAVPTYNLGCANTARRPFRNSLASFQPAQRGKVTIYPSPTLEDITTGVGLWTEADDANEAAVKEACATIECATPVEYVLYGIYRCITIKNLLQMTFPELVEAYLNRLSAAWARLAEVTLLNAAGTAADTVDVIGTGFGGSVSLLRGVLQYLNGYQELQRWDVGQLDGWAHRGLLNAIKADILARRRTDGGVSRAPSDAEINSAFRDVGINMTWFIDRPTWMTALTPFQGAGNQLANFPTSAEILVTPPGKLAVMDRGELNIGVTGNGLYRDNTSNSRNEFTFFFESFEGLVDTDSCPAHILQFDNLCFNGRQLADLWVNCYGLPEESAESS